MKICDDLDCVTLKHKILQYTPAKTVPAKFEPSESRHFLIADRTRPIKVTTISHNSTAHSVRDGPHGNSDQPMRNGLKMMKTMPSPFELDHVKKYDDTMDP